MLDPRVRIAVLVAATVLLAVMAAVGPAVVDVVAVGMVFVIGVVLGRVLPRDLPRVSEAVRPWRLAAAAAALTGAAAMLVLPSLRGDSDGDSRAAQTTTAGVAGPVAAASRPVVEQQPSGRAFVSERVRFRVFVPGRDVWAERVRDEPRAPGTRWVVVGVKATNLGRGRFNGNVLAYRLRAAGRLIAPHFSGGTGPNSLTATGRLARGGSSLSQLGFQVPRDAVGLRLVFEPEPGGDTQVQVVLDESASAP